MIDREYLKLNTSIQTASNSGGLVKDESGNLQAVVELRLPGNLCGNTTNAKTIDKIEMLTSKFRLSMETTPIAQLPIDVELSRDGCFVSTCQLDVYPYSFLSDASLAPADPNEPTIFPYYKSHIVRLRVFVKYLHEGSSVTEQTDEYIEFAANCNDTLFPRDNKYYEILKKHRLFDLGKHMMNLVLKDNHEVLKIENGSIFVHSIGTLEQTLNDALENAVTYASTESLTVYDVYFVDTRITDVTPPPDSTTSVSINTSNGSCDCYYWYNEYNESESSSTNHLTAAFKPFIKIDEQSLSISYDTGMFANFIPVLWNPSYVDTFDHPEQMTLDIFRKNQWNMPPLKRMYRYSVVQNEGSYNFDLNTQQCKFMNIIVNEDFKKVFSFLPWINVSLADYPESGVSKKKQIKNTEEISSEIMGDSVLMDVQTTGGGYTQIYHYQGKSVPDQQRTIRYLYTYYLPPDVEDIPEL